MINCIAVVILALNIYSVFRGVFDDKYSFFLFLALVFIAQALKEISQRLDKIEEKISKENKPPSSDK